MRIGRRLVKGMVWGVVLIASILAGGLWFVYVYLTDGTTVARMIKDSASRYLPGSTLEPGRARLSLFGGSLALHEAMIRQPIDGVAFLALRIPWLQIQFSPRRLFSQGRLEVAEIRASHPVLRLKRRRNGRWNIQGLLADPWPGPELDKSPPIVITNGTLELVDDLDHAPAPPGGPARAALAPAVLRELMLRIDNVAGSLYKFEGSARGDMFDRLALDGTLDIETGIIELGGSLSGLTLSEALRRRIPVEARPAVDQLALNGGLVDLEGVRLKYDPKAPPAARLRHHAQVRLREGVWECTKLPFPLSEVSAQGVLDDGVLELKHLEGANGQTTVRAAGRLGLPPNACTCFDINLEINDLELDRRLRARTPPEFDELWDVFSPRGRVNVDLRVSRVVEAGPVEVAATVDCRDVAGVYRHFPYPLDHLTGRIEMAGGRVMLDLETLVGGKPIRLKGEIDEPGDDAVVKLVIEADGAPVDETFKKALPPDVRKILADFNPSGVVKARAVVNRRPEPGPDPKPEGLITIDAVVDLAERCEMTWKPLPFAIRDLTGRLELHPDSWTFKDMRGRNGQAIVTASGRVEKLPIARTKKGEEPLKVDVYLRAANLPLSDELKRALPQAWGRKTWDIINPAGACDIETAEVHVAPGRPDRTHIVIIPRPESSVRLEVPRSPGLSKEKGGVVELRMDRVGGRFVFDDGAVRMHDVGFEFRGAQARFAKGAVTVEDSGRFDLAVNDLWVDGLRFDEGLRKKMPQLMAQPALRLDDGRTFRARGDLEIGWSGRPGDLAWCRWDKTLVVFLNNTVKTAIPLEHVQGQIQGVQGWSNGAVFEVGGVLRLDSVVVAGQQFTELESPFSVKNGVARLENLKGIFLGGQLLGEGRISLDTTPRYAATLALDGAKLQEYARTLPGRQSFSGTLGARIAVSGLGNDVRNLQGEGEAHITEGTLGELPPVLKLARIVNRFLDVAPSADTPRNRGKTAFDSADVVFTIQNGTTTFDPIKFTGNAISLQGQGTMGPTGALDLKLSVLWGRDRIHVPVLSDFAREASTPFLIARIKGTLANPLPKLEPLPQFGEFLKKLRQ